MSIPSIFLLIKKAYNDNILAFTWLISNGETWYLASVLVYPILEEVDIYRIISISRNVLAAADPLSQGQYSLFLVNGFPGFVSVSDERQYGTNLETGMGSVFFLSKIWLWDLFMLHTVCMSKKHLPILYDNLLYKMGNYFLDIRYILLHFL